MDFKLLAPGTLLLFATACAETPSNKYSADQGKLDDRRPSPCPLGEITEMIPSELPAQKHINRVLTTGSGHTLVAGRMKPVGRRDWVTFSIVLKPGVSPFQAEIAPGLYQMGEGTHLHLANEGHNGRYLRVFDLDPNAEQGSLEITQVNGRFKGVMRNAVLIEGRRTSLDYNDDCPSILVPELSFDAEWR